MDFYFSGKKLSDFGYVECYLDSNVSTTNVISQINFNQFKSARNDIWHKANTSYDSPLSTAIQICKNPCLTDDMEISTDELRTIQRWLCKKKFDKFYFIEDTTDETRFAPDIIYYNAKIDLNKIVIANKCVGLQLIVTTNAPYGFSDMSYKYDIEDNHTVSIDFDSDDEGYVYGMFIINVREDGDLTIKNSLKPTQTTIIKNCKVGDSILIDGKIMQIKCTREQGRTDLADDFNYVFPFMYSRGNLDGITTNKFTISLDCELSISYAAIRKVGI